MNLLDAAHRSRLRRATIEALEGRRLLAFSGTAFDVPLRLDFSGEVNGVEDRDGQNTGFPIVQGNSNGDELDANLIDLDVDDGVLRITSSGGATSGSNFDDDNSLVNGLQLPFNGSDDWLVHTRVGLAGEMLDGVDEAFEQFGLMVGASQDRYVKLVFENDGTDNLVQFLAETPDDSSDATQFPLGRGGATRDVTTIDGVNLATAEYIDLWLAGDADSGVISAQFRVEGGLMTRFSETFTPAVNSGYFRDDATRAGIIVVHKNDGDPITAEFDDFEVTRDDLPPTRLTVRESRPTDGDDFVFRDSFVAVDLELPNASVDGSTLTPTNVFLERTADGLRVPAEINTSGGGDTIILTPNRALDADTEYEFTITSGVTDLFGIAAEPFTSTFTTNFSLGGVGGDLASVAFEQVDLPEADGEIWSSVTLGPDGRLYATSIEGLIRRWDLEDDGTLGSSFDIDSITESEGDQRVVTGLTFGPDATASDLVAYVTHTQFNDVTTSTPSDLGDDFTGKVTRLSGDDLETVDDLVAGLPRSIRDHLTNQPIFGPDGRLYLGQGANTAMGAPDPAWGFRPERQLSGAVLAIDVDQIESDGDPVDVKTADGGTYDPNADGAPVVVYASGVRNNYDLVFHSNGSLYAPTNGSAAGGNTPAGPGNDPVGITNVTQTQNDYLFRIVEGGYYGHPNPTLNNFVLGGGNPSIGQDRAQVDQYPVGTFPEDDYRGFAFDFGKNQSPNGVIEYTADAFGGALKGKLIVTRWSGGDDLIVLDVEDNGIISDSTLGVTGFTGLDDPLDLVQASDGAIYVSEYGQETITLLRPVKAGGTAKEASRQIFVDAAAGEAEERAFTVRNTGTEPLIVSPYTLGLTGPDKNLFEFVNAPTQAITVPAGGSTSFDVRFNAPSGADVGDTFTATAFVRTSDPDAFEVGSLVTGFVRRGVEGANEPSLQQIFDVYDLGIETGDPDPTTTEIGLDELGGLDAQLFRAANPDKPVAIEVIASYSPDRTPVLSFGHYEPGRPETQTKIGEVYTAQGLDPDDATAAKFFVDGEFGLYVKSPAFLDAIGGGITDTRGRVAYTENALNTWEPTPGERDKAAVYNIDAVENALAVGFEEFEFANDYNDVVVVMTNVVAIDADEGRLAATANGAEEGLNRLVFSEIPPGERDDRFDPQFVNNTRTVPLVNTGNDDIEITGVNVPSGFDANDLAGTVLEPGDSVDLILTFDAEDEGVDGGFYEGDAQIETTGLDLVIPVSGYFMPYSEDDIASGIQKDNEEPLLAEMIEIFGLGTDVGTEAERLTGTPDAVGDEVLSPFWRAAQEDLPVEVYQLAAFHSANTADSISWFPETLDESTADSNSQLIFRHDRLAFQTFMPAIQGGNAPAAGTFDPAGLDFGFRIVNEYSVDAFNDDSTNPTDPNAQDLHLLRFFPVKRPDGSTVEDTWLLTMDFTGFNFDYNDNVYVIKNIEPANQAAGPVGASGGRINGGDDLGLAIFAIPEDAAAVSLFRSDNGGDSFDFVETVSDRGFLELEKVEDDTIVRIVSLDANGNEGTFSEVAID
jgi:glucose/arabinose dehydrogenase